VLAFLPERCNIALLGQHHLETPVLELNTGKLPREPVCCGVERLAEREEGGVAEVRVGGCVELREREAAGSWGLPAEGR